MYLFTAANVLFSILCCSGQTFALVRCGLDTAHFLCCIVIYLLDLQQYHGHWSSWANCNYNWADLPLNVVDVRLADSKNIWIGKLYIIKFLTPPKLLARYATIEAGYTFLQGPSLVGIQIHSTEDVGGNGCLQRKDLLSGLERLGVRSSQGCHGDDGNLKG